MKHNARLDLLTDYPFQRLASLLEGITPGQSPLVMSIGEPQHPVPALVGEVFAAHVPLWGKYPPTPGTEELRLSIAAWLTQRYALPSSMIDEGGIVPVSGTREALYMAGQLLLSPGSPKSLSLMPNPFYQVYYGSAVMNGGEPVLLDAGAKTGFLPDFSTVSAETWDKVALLTLCSPANPQGSVVSLDQWKELILLARRHDFVLLADECYSEIYTETPPAGALEACRDLGGSLDNVLVFNSLSKRSSVPGLRSGFVVGDRALVRQFLRLRAYGNAGISLPAMKVSAALWADESHVVENRRLYQEKIADAAEIIGSRFDFRAPAGGFFLWLNVGDGELATRRLWQEAGVKVLPGAYLARDGKDGGNVGQSYIRVALVHDRLLTQQALQRMMAVL